MFIEKIYLILVRLTEYKIEFDNGLLETEYFGHYNEIVGGRKRQPDIPCTDKMKI
jgi:hypothetical protein